MKNACALCECLRLCDALTFTFKTIQGISDYLIIICKRGLSNLTVRRTRALRAMGKMEGGGREMSTMRERAEIGESTAAPLRPILISRQMGYTLAWIHFSARSCQQKIFCWKHRTAFPSFSRWRQGGKTC